MTKDTHLNLAILHYSGFTQKDLMKFHILGYDFDTLVEKLKTENLFPIPWITQERKSKILEKLKKVDSENIKRIMNEQ